MNDTPEWTDRYITRSKPSTHKTEKDVYVTRGGALLCVSCAVGIGAELSEMVRRQPCEGCGERQGKLL